ncbi:type VII secretion target [Actinoplanes sp. NBRC 103695]|uniref:type VII secretion target n=1 Tax=Actinoplanes sp. NBRC 103695 TaxID=3032202 RepID=UPI0024A30812|nr:type VII secretion target [Actinoplanes sp. NBRC 103695]GLZ02084.1 hypothetical protein Acsp02_93350 [Actinoplanes sp. NBRC 103695]
MAESFNVDAAQLRRHAAHVQAVRDQLGAIKSASAAIGQNDAAYGLLCGWIAGILEARHRRQDTLYSYVEENLTLAAEAPTANDYEATDTDASERIRRSGGAR